MSSLQEDIDKIQQSLANFPHDAIEARSRDEARINDIVTYFLSSHDTKYGIRKLRGFILEADKSHRNKPTRYFVAHIWRD